MGNYTVDDARPAAVWHTLLHAAAVTWLPCAAATLALFARRFGIAR